MCHRARLPAIAAATPGGRLRVNLRRDPLRPNESSRRPPIAAAANALSRCGFAPEAAFGLHTFKERMLD